MSAAHEERRRRLAEERYGGICECGDHAWCRLTKGFVALVEVADSDIIKELHFIALTGPYKSLVYASHGKTIDGKTHQFLLHREVLGISQPMLPTRSKVETNFKNENTLDCRRRNLEPCDHVVSMAHKHKQAKARSHYKGVHYLDPRPNHAGAWRARLSHKGKRLALGNFPLTPEGEIAAAHAYDDAARKLFGNFAVVNFPLPGERGGERAA